MAINKDIEGEVEGQSLNVREEAKQEIVCQWELQQAAAMAHLC